MSDRAALFRLSRSHMQAKGGSAANAKKHGTSAVNSYFFVKRP